MDGPTSRLPSNLTGLTRNGERSSTTRKSDSDFFDAFYGYPFTAPAMSYTPQINTPTPSMMRIQQPPTPAPKFGVDPPRPAKDGYEWVWYPAGFWAERQVIIETPGSVSGRRFQWKRSGKNSSSRETNHSPKSARVGSTATNFPNKMFSELNSTNKPPRTPYMSEKDHILSLQRPSIGGREPSEDSMASVRLGRGWIEPLGDSPVTSAENSPHESLGTPRLQDTRPAVQSPLKVFMRSPTTQSSDNSQTTNPKTSLMSFFSRPRKEKPHDKKISPPKSEYASYTKATLGTVQQSLSQGTSPTGLFPRNYSRTREEHEKGSVKGSDCDNGNGRWNLRKLFGKNRKTSGDSVRSASSSIRMRLKRRTGNDTPASDVTAYFPGGDSREDWSEMYPGGEARRVKTPPLKSTQEYQHRALFNNSRYTLSTPTSDNFAKPPIPSPLRPLPEHEKFPMTKRHVGRLPPSHKRHYHRKGREWWEVPGALTRLEELGPPKSFEFDIPEHLPDSPMCPANQKQRGGGTGVCVYHGRKRSSMRTQGTGSEWSGVDEAAADARVDGDGAADDDYDYDWDACY